MDPQVLFDLKALDQGRVSLTLPSFGALFSRIQRCGIRVIGCDFLTTQEQANGHSPPEWRSMSLGSTSPWLCGEQGDHWSFIAHGAFNHQIGALWDIAGRISHQLRACDWRLRQLSDAYADQLRPFIGGKEFREGKRFTDGYTLLCFLALHAFLVDACVLRDYLAEFYAWVGAHNGMPISPHRITSMGTLVKRLDAMKPTDAFGTELRAVTQPGSWLHELGAYRDLIVHVAPLAKAGNSFFAVTRIFVLSGSRQMPGIKLPLPNDPTQLSQERGSGTYFDDKSMDFARFSSVSNDHAGMRDGLEYAHDSLHRLSLLAASASTLAPVPAEIPRLTAADITDLTRVKGRDVDEAS
jgi:hypothetical protein